MADSGRRKTAIAVVALLVLAGLGVSTAVTLRELPSDVRPARGSPGEASSDEHGEPLSDPDAVADASRPGTATPRRRHSDPSPPREDPDTELPGVTDGPLLFSTDQLDSGIGLEAGNPIFVRSTVTGRVAHTTVVSHNEQAFEGTRAIEVDAETIGPGPYELIQYGEMKGLSFGLLKSTRTFSAEELGVAHVEMEPAPTSNVALRMVDDVGDPVAGILHIHVGTELNEVVLGLPISAAEPFKIQMATGTYVAEVREVNDGYPFLRGAPRETFTVIEGSGATVDVVVPRAAELHLTLVDENDAPLRAVHVGTKSGGEGHTQYAFAGRTDAAGFVRLGPLPPGELALLVNVVGRPAHTQRLAVVPGEHRELTIALPAGGVSLRGRLIGVPRSEIKQLNLAYRSAPAMEAFNLQNADIGDDGSFAFDGLKPGLYDVHPVLRNGTSGYRRVRLTDALTDLQDMDISALTSTGDITVFCMTTVEDWQRWSFWGQYRRNDWPPGFWRFVDLKTPGPTHIDLAPGTYTFRLTPEANATDAFRAVSVEDFVVAEDHVETNSVDLHASAR